MDTIIYIKSFTNYTILIIKLLKITSFKFMLYFIFKQSIKNTNVSTNELCKFSTSLSNNILYNSDNFVYL